MHDDTHDVPGQDPGAGTDPETGKDRLKAAQRHWAAEKVAVEQAAAAKAGQQTPLIPEDVTLRMVPPPPASRWAGIGKVLMLVLVSLTAWNLYSTSNPPTLTSREGEELAARFELYLLAQEIEAYKEARGRLPETVLQVGEMGDHVGYVANADGSFTLSAAVSGGRVLYKPGTEDALYEKMVERAATQDARMALDGAR